MAEFLLQFDKTLMVKRHKLRYLPGFFLLLLLTACGSDDDLPSPFPDPDPVTVLDQDVVQTQSLSVNASGVAPLTAVLAFTTSEAVTTRIRVIGKNGTASDVVKDFDTPGLIHGLPILGLYADYENEIEVTLFNSTGTSLGTSSFTIETNPLISDMPSISIQTNDAQKEAGMTLVSYFGHNGTSGGQKPFIFDEFGDIRWYLDFSSNPVLTSLFYDDGMERLQNGNYYFGDRSTSRIYEVNIIGQILNVWEMPGYTFHHEVHEKPNGNFLVTVNSQSSTSTVEDHIIEIDRSTGEIITVWDLRESLQRDRMALTTDQSDWIHVNAVTYDSNDDTIIISGRTQGVIKLTHDNEVVWILATHRGWGMAGDGTDLTTKLLQPLDGSGQPIDNTSILDGAAISDSFEWPWYQHAPQVMPNGNVLLFDNGDNRNYEGGGAYSRAVEYTIDKNLMTVQQVWSYGKDRGSETYSRIVSDVDYHASSNHVFFSPGAITTPVNYGRVMEIDYTSKEVLFEASIIPPQAPFNITFHRTERLSLYPD
jgi:arylsulfate sulfotransferase